MTTEAATLWAAWDEAAEDWVTWARSPELDHAFWRLDLPALLSLLPEPGDLTLDLACGEGRLARELIERGHRLVGVESSPALAAVARDTDPSFSIHVAEPVATPLLDDAADLVVASLALAKLDDMPGVVAEVARVLRAGGRFCFSLVHPLDSWGDEAQRPLATYFEELERAGFEIDAVTEPVPSAAYMHDWPEVARWRERPAFLHVRAIRLPEPRDARAGSSRARA